MLMKEASQNATWLSLHLPRLATDRLLRARAAPEGRALAAYAKEKNAYVLSGVDARASALGLYVGQALADARAIHPALHVSEAEPAEDARTLDAIAAWCERFTPIVVIDAPDGLFLDVTGCGHLFGGDVALRDELVTRLTAQGFACRAALGATPGAAWGLARFEPSPPLRGGGLEALSIEALRLDDDAAALLRRLGLKTVGQLIEAPRSAFTARAGQRAMLRLDQALGRASEALSPRRPAPPVFALRRFLEPLFSVETILVVTQDLCADVVELLDRRGAGARACALHLFGVDGRDRVIEIGLSQPERAPQRLLRLFREKLDRAAENFDAEFGIEAARLDVVQMERTNGANAALVADIADRAGDEDVAGMVDVLSARLGAKRVLRAQLLAAHQPERAGGWEAALAASFPLPLTGEVIAKRSVGGAGPSPLRRLAALAATSPVNGGGNRPLSLFASPQRIDAIATVPDGPPIRFRWRRVLREVVRAEGPERIAGDWLKCEPTRDFYRIEDRDGRRYWLCREGLYGEDTAPRWFVAGLFG
jgi:protein ImuB